AGILAAAAHHALEHHIDRLADDHRLAQRLAKGLSDIGTAQGGKLRLDMPQTNIVFVEVAAEIAADLAAHLNHAGVQLNSRGGTYGAPAVQRWVTHLDVSDTDVDAALSAVGGFFR
ncbi:MAG: Low specificity L-threonine aldolase, partial [Pseudomonadota bacterium]